MVTLVSSVKQKMHCISGWFNIWWICRPAQIWSDLLWSFIRAVKNLHNITIGSTTVFTAAYVKVLESYTYSSCKFYSDFAVLVGFIFTWIIWSANYGTRSCNLSIIWGIAINCYDICNEITWCSMLVDYLKWMKFLSEKLLWPLTRTFTHPIAQAIQSWIAWTLHCAIAGLSIGHWTSWKSLILFTR